MKRLIGLALALATITGLGVASVQANIFKKWPSAVSTGVTFNYGTPIVFGITINGQGIAQQHIAPLNDLGEIQRKGPLDRNLSIEAEWIETLSGRAYAAAFDIPVDDLSSHEGDGDHVNITIRIGANGAIVIETPNQEMLLLLHSGQEESITPELDLPVRLAQSCAAEVGSGSAHHAKLTSWIDDWARSFLENYKDSIANAPPDPLADLGCGGSR